LQPRPFLLHGTETPAKGRGVFACFYPYLREALPLHGPPWHLFAKGWGNFACFHPYLHGSPSFSGTLALMVGVFFALFTPTFGKRQAPSPLSFRLQKFTLRPSSRPAVHHSAVFCTERSRECLAYRKMPVFCTACIRKRLAYNRRPLFCTGRRIASRL